MLETSTGSLRLPGTLQHIAFAATCQELRSIWIGNIAVIYRSLAPRSIKCETHARLLRAEQLGCEKFEISELSVRDVVVMLHNADVIDRSLLNYEAYSAQTLTCQDYLSGPCHEPVDRLSPSERKCFTRNYYLAWRMITISNERFAATLQSLRLKALHSFLNIVFHDGDGTLLSGTWLSAPVMSPPVDQIPNLKWGEERMRFIQATRKQCEVTFHRAHGVESDDFFDIDHFSQSCLPIDILWDNYQSSYKIQLCRTPGSHVLKEEFWDDTSDEEE